jgi:hypothetical protein
MNSERFNSALDGISDDLIDAAAGAYEKKANRKKTVIRVAWAACALLVLTAIGLFWKAPAGVIDPTQPTISMENPTTAPTKPTEKDIIVHTGNVYFLSSEGDTPIMTPVQANMTLPVDNIIRIRNLRGLSEAEKYQAIVEENAFMEEFREQRRLFGEGHGEFYPEGDVLIMRASCGFASILILDGSQIESVTRESTGILGTGQSKIVYHKDCTYGEGENALTIPAGSVRYLLDCSLGDYATRNIFITNPDTPLSSLRDTFTVTINYKNGTKEIVVIDVTVDDDGQIYMTQRGDNTGV